MSFASIYKPGQCAISFELFPPKTPRGEKALYRHVGELLQARPAYFTCTYGAGGTDRGKTIEIVTRVKQQAQVPVAAHLTCVDSTVDQLRDYLRQARAADVDYIVALRGDPPQGVSRFEAHEGGFHNANQLVTLIRSEFPEFGIAVAGYPETHREAPSAETDLDNLKTKVDAGADVVLTQLFYNNEDFFRFRDRYDHAGIRVPLVPGILPVTGLAQVQRITALCGAKLPEEFVRRLAEQDDPKHQLQVGIEHAIGQASELVSQGVAGLHFFVLNRSEASLVILQAIKQI